MKKARPRPAAGSAPTKALTRKTTPQTTHSTSTEADPRRRHRARTTPSWLLEQQDLDDIARRRCLMVLSVLSGETPVTDAIASANISRQLYYQLEERALKAMLKALTPGSESAPVTGPDPASLRRIAELEAKVSHLEQDKRRIDRLLYLTRKVVKTGPLTTGSRGRPPKPRLSSPSAGPRPLRYSAKTSPTPPATGRLPADGMDASTPTPDGEVEPSNGTES